MIELRPYQIEAIEAIETAEKDGTKRQLVALPTGTGKTLIFATCLPLAQAGGSKEA